MYASSSGRETLLATSEVTTWGSYVPTMPVNSAGGDNTLDATQKNFFFHFFWCFSLHILVDLAWLCSNLWDGENMLRPLWHRILIIIHTIYLIFCSYMNLISHLNMGGVSLVFNVKFVFWFSSETWLHATPHDSIHNLLRIVQLSTIWPLFPNSLCAKSFCLC